MAYVAALIAAGAYLACSSDAPSDVAGDAGAPVADATMTPGDPPADGGAVEGGTDSAAVPSDAGPDVPFDLPDAAQCPSFAAKVADAGAVAHFRFEEDGGTTLVDKLGGAPATITGNVHLGVRALAGKGLTLPPGSNASIDFGTRFKLQPPLTIEFWARAANPGQPGCLLSHAYPSGDGVFYYLDDTGAATHTIEAAGPANTDSFPGGVFTEWTHFAYTLAPGGPLRFGERRTGFSIVGGGVGGQPSFDAGGGGSVLHLATAGGPCKTPLIGQIDELVIYARVLSDSELAAHASCP